MSELPILYSFRRCPYAIRARMALTYAGVTVELREVHLKNKPGAMLEASAKGTVPVLVLPGAQVIDESLSIMHWALDTSLKNDADPDNWLAASESQEHKDLVEYNDGPFKLSLDQYKYADRHPEHSSEWYRGQAMPFLQSLNQRLQQNPWLLGSHMQLTDVALFPFIRQFAMVDRPWFDASGLDALRGWLDTILGLPLFQAVMIKNGPWVEGQSRIVMSV